MLVHQSSLYLCRLFRLDALFHWFIVNEDMYVEWKLRVLTVSNDVDVGNFRTVRT